MNYYLNQVRRKKERYYESLDIYKINHNEDIAKP